MKKVPALILILLLVHLSDSGVWAQDKGLMISLGGASFQMDDLKRYQEYILSSYPVEGKIVSSFPPYTMVSINFFKQISSSLKIGAGYVYTTTGGKSDYSDFSGNIHTSIIALSHRLGGYASYTFFGSDHIDLSLFGRLDANITRLRVISVIYASGLSNSAENKYKSVSPNTSAGLEFMYKFKRFGLGLDGGYLADFPGKLKAVEKGSRLYDPADAQNILTSDWSGWRVNIKANIWLNF